MTRYERLGLTDVFSASGTSFFVRRRRTGTILFIMMVALVVMAGLVFFVFNLGGQINARIETQAAADSTALGGGAWLARSMNVIAENNMMQARLIGSVAIIDAMPLAAETALYEIMTEVDGDSLYKGLENQLKPDNGKEAIPVSRLERCAKTTKSWALSRTVADAVLFMPSHALTTTDKDGKKLSQPIPLHYMTDRRRDATDRYKIYRDWWSDPYTKPPESMTPSLKEINLAVAQGVVNDLPTFEGNWKPSSSPVNAYGGGSYDCMEDVAWSSYPESPASNRASKAAATWSSALSVFPSDILPASDTGKVYYDVYVWCSCDSDGRHRDNAAQYSVDVSSSGTDGTWMSEINVSSFNQNMYTGWWQKIGRIGFAASQTSDAKVYARVVLTPKLVAKDPTSSDLTTDSFIIKGLEKIRDELDPDNEDADSDTTSQVTMLRQLDGALDSRDEGAKDASFLKDDPRGREGGSAYDLHEATYWDGGNGKIWRSVAALQNLSETTAQVAALTAQNNAVNSAKDNKASAGVIVPVVPELPVKQGSFEDFQMIMNGNLTITENRANHLAVITAETPISDIIKAINKLDSEMKQLESEMTDLAKKWKELYDQIVAIKPGFDFDNPTDGLSEESAEFQALVNQWISVDESLCAKEDQYRTKQDQKYRTFYTIHQRARGGLTPDATVGTYDVPDDRDAVSDLELPYRLGPFMNYFSGFRRWPGYPYYRDTSTRKEWSIGPYLWGLERIWNVMGQPGTAWGTGMSDLTRFSTYTTLISNIKLAYMYDALENKEQKVRYGHRFITDYEKAKKYIDEEGDRRFESHKGGKYYISKILLTRYYRLVVYSTLSCDDSAWLCDPATFYSPQGNSTISPQNDAPSSWTWEPKYWYDIEKRLSSNPNSKRYASWEFTRLCKYAWRVKATRYNDGVAASDYGRYRTNNFPQVNAHIRLDSTGNLSDDDKSVPWRIYETRWYVFGGLEVYQDERLVQNPFDWTDTSGLPVPMLLDANPLMGTLQDYGFDADSDWRREKFTFLGAAMRTYDAPAWSSKFSTGNPSGKMVCVSQVSLFNNKSWDLWTPAWQVQTVPVTKWQKWATEFEKGTGQLSEFDGAVKTSDYEDMSEFIQRLDPEASDQYIKH